MKRFALRTLLVTVAVIGIAAPPARAQVGVDVTIGGFYEELAPYGRWVDCSYGQCWVPERVAADWQPYSNGQWIYTEYGWTWVSNDPWGGSPYHYGTWTSIRGHRWAWVPGTVWAPAWVTWNYSNSYVGWAPLPPSVVFGASGYSGRPVVVSRAQYVFVPTRHFVGRNVATVRMPAGRSAEIFRHTRPVTGFAVSGGIVRNTALPVATIERAGGGRIETRSIQTAGTAPRPVSAGTAHLAVVAPAREVRAAAAARPQSPSRPPEQSREGARANEPATRRPGGARASRADERPLPHSQNGPAEATAERRHGPPRKAASGPSEHGAKSKPQSGREPIEKRAKPDGEKP